ncbi:hypothetical protein GQ457_06G002100 [Hibiscus cannabinus]
MEKQSKAYVVVLPTMSEDPEEFVFIEEDDDDDLCHWEFIHSSDSGGSDSDAGDVNVNVKPLVLSSPRDIAIPEMISVGDDHGPYTCDLDDDDDLDDELIPRGLSGKVGRQRMRKVGKRGFAKMNNSKRSPFLYVKPGCVHGKHGLGLKHSF